MKIESGCLAVTRLMLDDSESGIVVEVLEMECLLENPIWLVRVQRLVNVHPWNYMDSGELSIREGNLRPITPPSTESETTTEKTLEVV